MPLPNNRRDPIRAELETLPPGSTRVIGGKAVTRWSKSYEINTLGREDALLALEAAIDAVIAAGAFDTVIPCIDCGGNVYRSPRSSERFCSDCAAELRFND